MSIDFSREQPDSVRAYGILFFSRSPFRSFSFVTMTISLVICLGLVMLIVVRYSKLFLLIPALFVVACNVAGAWWKMWGYLDRLRELRENVTEGPGKADLDTALGISARIATESLLFSFNAIAVLLVLAFFTLKFVNRI